MCEELTTEADNVANQPLYDLLDPSKAAIGLTRTHSFRGWDMYTFT